MKGFIFIIFIILLISGVMIGVNYLIKDKDSGIEVSTKILSNSDKIEVIKVNYLYYYITDKDCISPNAIAQVYEEGVILNEMEIICYKDKLTITSYLELTDLEVIIL